MQVPDLYLVPLFVSADMFQNLSHILSQTRVKCTLVGEYEQKCQTVSA